MTYNTLLDGFFGNYWIYFGSLVAYLAVVIYFHQRLFGGKKRKVLAAFMYYFMPFFWLAMLGGINPVWLGYGYPSGITDVRAYDGKLFVQDYQMTAGSKSSRGSAYSRIHIIDPVTGERKVRFQVGGGRGDILGFCGDTLVYTDDVDVHFYSIIDGHEFCVWSAETLPGVFPELSSGLSDFSAYKTRNDLHVTSMDGNHWVIDILGHSIQPDDYSEMQAPTGKTFISNGIIVLDNEVNSPEVIVGFTEKGNGGEQVVLCNDDDSVLNPDLVFLQAEIVGFSQKDSCFIVKHYATVARTNAIFTCVSWDCKRKLWEVRQHDLRPDDPLEEDEDDVAISSALDEAGGAFLISFNTEIISIGLKDGAVKWRQVP